MVPCMLFVLGGLLISADGSSPSRMPAPDFEIDLDVAPQQRFSAIIAQYNSSIQELYHHFFHGLQGDAIKAALFGIAAMRGHENEELQGEIDGIARLTNLPAYGIHVIQMLYELQTVMVPIENITINGVPIHFPSSLPWKGPGCTGILATNTEDGMVYHGRNQDFSPAALLQPLVYTGIFKKGGEELFRGQMIAGFTLPLTGIKFGENGFSFETNTRYLDHIGGNKEMLHNLLGTRDGETKRELNGWSIRKAAETSANYEEFVDALSTAKYVAPEYNIIGGVRKGTILARNPDDVAYRLVLGKPNYQCRDDYILVTNFDFWWNDVREQFDFTAENGIFSKSRRIAAQEILNATESLTPDVVFSVIDDDGVRATDTIYQALMSVEAGIWNVSLPMCKLCNGSQTGSVLI